MSENSYQRVEWQHDIDSDPIEIWSELDHERWELRKFEVYRDGSVSFADEQNEVGGSFLGEEPWPPNSKIEADPQFSLSSVTQDLFEERWASLKSAKIRVAK